MRQKLIIRILSIASILGCVTTSYEAAKRTADEFASESGRQQRQHVAVDASTAAAAASAVATFSAAAPASTRSQIYGIPTYDALFKWVLSHDDVPSSFFKAFIPGVGIVSSERLDDHMHPVQSLQTLRTFLHQEGTKRTVERLSGATEARVVFPQPAAATDEAATYVHDIEATAFLHEVIGHFDDIKSAFPKVRYDGTMDFVCQLSTGDYAMVEMQVIPQDHWDRRALAYAAAFYGNQLFKGDEWKHIRRVVGVNILGGGKDNLVHWKDTPGQFIRHYKIQEQLHLPARYIDGIELIQYSIMNARGISLEEKEMQDWITFFSKAHYMSEEDVHEQITTPAVLRAFELSKIQKLPREVLVSYEEQDRDYDRYSEHTHGLITQSRDEGHAAGHAAGRVEGIEEGRILEKITLAREMIAHRLEVNLIMEIAKLTREEIEALQRGERLAIERELETARAAATGSAQ